MERDYANDCIHLKACRRICKYHKINNRGCRKDYCTAYEPKGEDVLVPLEDAIEVARSYLRRLEYGESMDDLTVGIEYAMESIAI